VSGNRAQRRGGARTPPTLENRYGSRKQRRALAPAVVGTLVLLVGLLLVGQEGYLLILYGVSILSLITAVFVWQARQWAWLPVPIVVAVLWNPIVPFSFAGQPFRLGHLVAAAALLLTGAFARYSPPDP
jgi:hypothetical protein